MSDGSIAIGDEGGFFPVPNAEVLVVLLHAFTLTPKNLQRVAEIVREEYPRSDVYAPKLPVEMFSCADPEAMSRDIVEYIAALSRIDSYRSIILIGHSLGAVVARKVWALAHGATPAASCERAQARTWARKIDRIVLLAATNRGWMISSALSPFHRLGWTLGTAWGNFLRHVFAREPTIFGFRRGAPFLTTVRLQCLAVTAALGADQPITVQLLGTADDYVAPTDNLDLATGRNFYYIEIGAATHRGIAALDEGDGSTGALSRFRLALTGDRQSLAEVSLSKQDVDDLYDEAPDDYDLAAVSPQDGKVDHVVFVIHGIRDRGFWTRRIAQAVKSLARERGQGCRAVTSTYGYFPMGPFLLPWTRRSKVEWLLDQYVMAKSLYPDAQFSYIGHSNGTYLLAKALDLCPAVRFQHVVFGGSVVRSTYSWSRVIPAQLARILNYVATDDRVVAIFPQGLERMRLQDLGGAGHLGFSDPQAINLRHVEGGHSAALADTRWREMASFVLSDEPPRAPVPVPRQTKGIDRLARFAPAIWFALAVIILAPAAGLLYAIGTPGAYLAVVFVLYLYVVKTILTRA
jgi:pimeloyl-ACP methyl ester carboxylesterase